MRTLFLNLVLALAFVISGSCQEKPNLDQYPHVFLSNDQVKMKVFTIDPQQGIYRATRFDWSGIIGSVQFKGHEYFAYWKDRHDPSFHEDLAGPAEGFIEAGPGYKEAKPGGKFIRIGVGVLEKPDEERYVMKAGYKILDHGTWKTELGADWITFTQTLSSNFGYGYVYTKTIRLKNDGFTMEHSLQNTGEKLIETDQFNHNFFTIDNQQSGPPFKIIFPYDISTNNDLKGFLEIDGNELKFIKKLESKTPVFNNSDQDDNVFLVLTGYNDQPSDHQVTVLYEDTGTGITFSVNKPLYRMAFWACKSTFCPENSIWISVKPGETERWTSDYTLLAK